MGKFDLKEIHERIEETSKWNKSDEKSMAMKALGSMLLSRMGQDEILSGIYLERDHFRLPSILNRVFHLIGFHVWLDFDDSNVFDGTRRICLVCGLVQSSMMNREWAYFEGGSVDKELLGSVLKHIRRLGNKEDSQ